MPDAQPINITNAKKPRRRRAPLRIQPPHGMGRVSQSLTLHPLAIVQAIDSINWHALCFLLTERSILKDSIAGAAGGRPDRSADRRLACEADGQQKMRQDRG